MPGRRKILPRPCPICKKEYGTFQVVFFIKNGWHLDSVLRIGHYDAESYKRARQRSNNIEYQVKKGDVKLKKDVKNVQRKWCSFRSYHQIWDQELIKKLMIKDKMKTWTSRHHSEIFLEKVRESGWGKF